MIISIIMALLLTVPFVAIASAQSEDDDNMNMTQESNNMNTTGTPMNMSKFTPIAPQAQVPAQQDQEPCC